MLLGGLIEIRELPADQRRAFLQGAAGDRVVGGRTYDAHIAEIARLARAPMVVTDNVSDTSRRCAVGASTS